MGELFLSSFFISSNNTGLETGRCGFEVALFKKGVLVVGREGFSI